MLRSLFSAVSSLNKTSQRAELLWISRARRWISSSCLHSTAWTSSCKATLSCSCACCTSSCMCWSSLECATTAALCSSFSSSSPWRQPLEWLRQVSTPLCKSSSCLLSTRNNSSLNCLASWSLEAILSRRSAEISSVKASQRRTAPWISSARFSSWASWRTARVCTFSWKLSPNLFEASPSSARNCWISSAWDLIPDCSSEMSHRACSRATRCCSTLSQLLPISSDNFAWDSIELRLCERCSYCQSAYLLSKSVRNAMASWARSSNKVCKAAACSCNVCKLSRCCATWLREASNSEVRFACFSPASVRCVSCSLCNPAFICCHSMCFLWRSARNPVASLARSSTEPSIAVMHS
mmetsp:Transcript_18534/g.46784  ORF Transcript_18534/g.46784 Transcript_18534/m.46784 type:complete len:353 (+) Transcript_18534:1350-2408(+)